MVESQQHGEQGDNKEEVIQFGLDPSPIQYANHVNAINNGDGVILEFRVIVPSVFQPQPVLEHSQENKPENIKKEQKFSIDLSQYPSFAKIFITPKVAQNLAKILSDTPEVKLNDAPRKSN